MEHEKKYTAKEAALAVLKKTQELLTKSELLKAEQLPAKKPEVDADQNAENQHAQGKAPSGEIHPKEHVEGASDDVRSQQAPEANPDEQKEGNNPEWGSDPATHGHIKLAKFIGHMEAKRKMRVGV